MRGERYPESVVTLLGKAPFLACVPTGTQAFFLCGTRCAAHVVQQLFLEQATTAGPSADIEGFESVQHARNGLDDAGIFFQPVHQRLACFINDIIVPVSGSNQGFDVQAFLRFPDQHGADLDLPLP